MGVVRTRDPERELTLHPQELGRSATASGFAPAQGLLEAPRRLRPADLAGVPDQRDEHDRRPRSRPRSRARATSRAAAARAGRPARRRRHERGPDEPPRAVSRRRLQLRGAKLVAHGAERVHGVVPHRRLRLMVAEPSPFEEIGEPADGSGARVEREERPLDVLERRLGGMRGIPAAASAVSIRA